MTNENTKNIFLTGGNGGIGGAIAKVALAHGYKIWGPLRDLAKSEEKLSTYPNRENFFATQADPGNAVAMDAYIADLHKQGIIFQTMILAAGTMIKESKCDSVEDSIEKNKQANLTTKENVIAPFLEYYGQDTKQTSLYPIGSQAAGFEVGHQYRVDEEGYVISHQGVRALGKRLGESGRFAKVYVKEPATVDTGLTRAELALDDNTGLPRDWSKEKSADTFAIEFLTEIGLIK